MRKEKTYKKRLELQSKMAGIQDSLTIGIVLFLLIAALGVYVWLRFQQVETRLSLSESILYDMKKVTEAYSQFPSIPATNDTYMEQVMPIATPAKYSASQQASVNKIDSDVSHLNQYEEMEPLSEMMGVASPMAESEYPSVLDEINNEMAESSEENKHDITIHQHSSNDYNGMILKDLRALAKSRAVTGTGSMSRGQLVTILREKDEKSTSAMQMEYNNEVSESDENVSL